MIKIVFVVLYSLCQKHRNIIFETRIYYLVNTLTIIDSHCHLDFPAFAQDHSSVLEQCQKNGITDIVIPGVTAKTLTNLVQFCASNTKTVKLHYALGLHPVFLDQHKENHLDALAELVNAHHPIAIGEIGLDFFLNELDQKQQISLFESQLLLAKKHYLPIIAHVRKAHDHVIKLLKKHHFSEGGIIHAFNGSIQQAQQYIELGYKLGFGGMLTYPHSRKLHNLAKQLPLSSIVLETDSPDMTVEAHRGKRNSPAYLPMVLKALANLREEAIEAIANITTENTKSVLRLDD